VQQKYQIWLHLLLLLELREHNPFSKLVRLACPGKMLVSKFASAKVMDAAKF